MSVETNKALVLRLVEEINSGNLSIVEDLFAPNVVDHAGCITGGLGLEGIKQDLRMFHAAFPDLHYTVDDLVAEGDRVVLCWTARGTHTGTFAYIPPTGQHIQVSGTDTLHIVNGKVLAVWENADMLGLLHQLGAILVLRKCT